MHEIVTIQLGQASNHVATHFWNTQESYFTFDPQQESQINHDIHFRTGQGAGGIETFTPRTVIYDLKGGFGSMRKLNALYEAEGDHASDGGAWTTIPTTITEPTIPTHAYQDSLEAGDADLSSALTTSTVKYWSDFNRVFYHPRTVVQLSDFELNSSLMPFDRWDEGGSLFENVDKEHDILDRDFRFFAEECDQMQAIQVLTSTDDAWGGFAARYLEALEDEYGKTARLVWGLNAGKGGDNRAIANQQVNSAKSLQSFAANASLYIPIQMPPRPLPSEIHLDRSSSWLTSALVATALESMMLFSRLKGNIDRDIYIDDAIATLNTNGHQNIAAITLDLQRQDIVGDHQHTLANGDSAYLQAMISDIRRPPARASTFAPVPPTEAPQTVAFLPSPAPSLSSRSRDQDSTAPYTAATLTTTRTPHPSTHTPSPDPTNPLARHRTLYTPLPFPLLSSFPPIYSPSLIHDSSVDLTTSLSTNGEVGRYIKGLRAVAGRLVDEEEREAMGEELGRVEEGYEEGWGEGSDEDDD